MARGIEKKGHITLKTKRIFTVNAPSVIPYFILDTVEIDAAAPLNIKMISYLDTVGVQRHFIATQMDNGWWARCHEVHPAQDILIGVWEARAYKLAERIGSLFR